MKKILRWILLIGLLFPSSVFACWGTGYLGRGGTPNYQPNDSELVYANPAGLALVNKTALSLAQNAGEKNDSNYDTMFMAATPVSNYGTAGIAFVHNEDKLYYSNRIKKGREAESRRDDYYQASYGSPQWEKGRLKLSLGASTKLVTKDEQTDGHSDQSNWGDIDLGGLAQYQLPADLKLSLGLLVQNVLEGQGISDRNNFSMIRNYRPSVSLEIPQWSSTISLEVYDATKETKGAKENVSQNIRIGVEKWFENIFYSTDIVVRGGIYHLNNEEHRAYTGGIGIELPLPENWEVKAEINWTTMYWAQSDSATHFAGLKCRF